MLAQVHLMGRLGHNPECRVTKDGTYVTTLSVAVDNPLDRDAPPDWWKVTCWDKRAEFAANWLQKGNRVYVIGTPRLEEWDGEDGQHHAKLGCTATNIQPIDWAEREGDAEAEDEPERPPARRPAAAKQTPAAKRAAYAEKVKRHGRLG